MGAGDLFTVSWLFPLAYLMGSIPTSIWVGKIFYGLDIRMHGSGNAGATNVMRVLGVRTGIPVLLFDMLKGYGAVMLCHLQTSTLPDTESWAIVSILLGCLAVIGHIYPIFAGFRGGKGVATIAGVCIALNPLATLLSLGVFILVLLLTRYVSLGSIIAGLSFPIWGLLFFETPAVAMKVFSLFAALLLVYTHRSNIKRLMKHEEKKATFLFKDRKK